MDFGIVLPTMAPGAAPEGIEAAAEVAERLGWSTVWVTDHVIPGRGPLGRNEEYAHIYEAISTLAYVAGKFPRLRLGTSAICVPMRNAVLLAKELASLDALARGRLVVSLGIGDEEDRPEFANLGASERFSRRGAYLEETIRLWRHLWSGCAEPFVGRFHHLEDFEFSPLPAQREHLPIWTGGRSEIAFRRAGRLSDGYHASQTGPEHLRPRVPTIRAEAEAHGRPMPSLSIRTRVKPFQPAGSTYALVGTPEAMKSDIEAFTDQGVEHLAVVLGATDPEGVVTAADWFDREVVAGLRP